MIYVQTEATMRDAINLCGVLSYNRIVLRYILVTGQQMKTKAEVIASETFSLTLVDLFVVQFNVDACV